MPSVQHQPGEETGVIPTTGANPKATFTAVLKRELGVSSTQADEAWNKINKTIQERGLCSRLRIPKSAGDLPQFKADLKRALGAASGTPDSLIVAFNLPFAILAIGALAGVALLIHMAAEEAKKNSSRLMKDITKDIHKIAE
jgi:hypothetical protein